MVCMFVTAIYTYVWSIFYGGIDDYRLYYKLDIIDATLGLTFFPFIYLYIKSLTDEKPFNWKNYLSFAPGVFVGIASALIYGWMGDVEAGEYLKELNEGRTAPEGYTKPVHIIHFWVNVVFYYVAFLTQIVWIMWYTATSLIKYRKRLQDFFSNLDGKSLESGLAILRGIAILLIMYIFGLLDMFLWNSQYTSVLVALFMGYSAMLYYLNYHVLKLEYTVDNLIENLEQTDREAEEKGYSLIKKSKRESILLTINCLLDEEKIFLKQELRMDDVVHLTEANRTYISLLIRDEYQCNFSELINRKRIEYAKRLAEDNPKLSQIQIAEQSGFTHPATFSRYFREFNGETFREWRKRV